VTAVAKRYILRLTGDQHAQLKAHLFPGDGLEAVAVALCGHRLGAKRHVLSVHRITPIPFEACTERTPVRVSWLTDLVVDVVKQAAAKGMAVLKIHSHPGYYERFSEVDDASDGDLFPSLHGWTDNGLPHASAVMLPDGRIFGRVAFADGTYAPVDRVAVAGDDILFFDAASPGAESVEQLRTRQAFGLKTTLLLKSLRVGIVGCSGTGSWIAEQLARLGVGEILLVDPDRVERKNLSRILATAERDAQENRPKVDAVGERLMTYGTGTRVQVIVDSALTSTAATDLADCDVVFGCMDSIEGRELLNRVAVFYSIPYFDLGIQLRADGSGSVETVCGSVHFLTPDGSSLLSRGVYTPEMLGAEALRRTNPERYASELKEGYVRGVPVGAPAVISVNGFCAAMAVNELLARLHPFRDAPNSKYRWQQFDVVNSYWQPRDAGERCRALARWAGRGDMVPLLNCNLIAA
jgi:hypothetical protein